MNQKKMIPSDFVYGLHTVTAVLTWQPERAKKLFIARKDAEPIKKLCERNGIDFEILDRSRLEAKFNVGSDAQGVLLLCTPFAYDDLDDLIHRGRLLLVLDSWQDAANLGRAARAALCFGADGIVICKDRSAHINASAEKSAVGALARMPVARVVNLSAAIKKMKEAGFFVYGADEQGTTSLRNCDFANKTAFVIGQEGEGLRELTKKNCDVLVNIPMANTDICLNAADAALLMLYEKSSQKIK